MFPPQETQLRHRLWHGKHTAGVSSQRLAGRWVQGCPACHCSMASVEETELSLSTPGELLGRASQTCLLELGIHSGVSVPTVPASWAHRSHGNHQNDYLTRIKEWRAKSGHCRELYTCLINNCSYFPHLALMEVSSYASSGAERERNANASSVTVPGRVAEICSSSI